MGNPPVDRPVVMGKIKNEFSKRDLTYVSKRDTLFERLAYLDGFINSRFQPISFQIYTEARWLILYTDDWPRASAVLDRLESSLREVPQTLTQQADGSWGRGYTEWYRKLEPTISALQQDTVIHGPLLPLKFMEKLQDPDYTLAYLDSLRTSKIRRTGRNNRDEYGSVQSALSQLLFKPAIARLLKDRAKDLEFKISDDLKKRYLHYILDVQSRVTGFWGPSYDFPGGTLEVQDMSFTFHNVHYYGDYGVRKQRGGNVPRLREIARTALEIKDFLFPNGWIANEQPPPPKPPDPRKPKYNDHNNYDVVTLFANCWPVVSKGMQTDMKAALQMLLDWCLDNSLKGDGFVVTGDGTPASIWYYAIRFLQFVGFWDGKAPWGWMKKTTNSPDPKTLGQALRSRFERDFDDNSPEAEKVKDILKAIAAGQPLPKLRPGVPIF